ncbi:hypothetical protein CFIICLFH_2263 [Methylobacterium goesingense]|nr:hypothetical protein CFIICLFH_2263 [Methylobacterium goesingense]
MPGLGRHLVHVRDLTGALEVNDGQAVGLRRRVEGGVGGRIPEATTVAGRAGRDRLAARLPQERRQVGAGGFQGRRVIREGHGRIGGVAHLVDHRRVAPDLTHVSGIVGEEVRHRVQGDRPAAQHVHRVMRPDDDAVAAVFGCPSDHLLVTLRHQDRENQGFRVAVGGVAARVGGAVGQALARPPQPVQAVGGTAEIVVSPIGEQLRQRLERAGVAVDVGPRRSRRPLVGFAEDVGGAAPLRQDGGGVRRDRRLAVPGRVGEEILAGVRVGLGDVVGVADEVGDGLRDVRKAVVGGVAGLGLIEFAEAAAEAVGEFRRVPVRDEGVAQGKLALLGERQQEGRLPPAGLDLARDPEIRLEGGPPLRAAGERAHGGEAPQAGEVWGRLRGSLNGGKQAEGERPDSRHLGPFRISGHGAPFGDRHVVARAEAGCQPGSGLAYRGRRRSRGRQIPRTTLAVATASSTQSVLRSAPRVSARVAGSTRPASARALCSASWRIGPCT